MPNIVGYIPLKRRSRVCTIYPYHQVVIHNFMHSIQQQRGALQWLPGEVIRYHTVILESTEYGRIQYMQDQ
jgi:hypothetical protein